MHILISVVIVKSELHFITQYLNKLLKCFMNYLKVNTFFEVFTVMIRKITIMYCFFE